MTMKKALLVMMALVILATTNCATILDIDHEYYDCAPLSYCGGSECVDESRDSKNCGSCGHDCQGGECREGQCQPVIIAQKQLMPTYIVVDAKNLYWTNRGSTFSSVDGSVMKMPIRGEAALTIASGQNQPRCIAVDATHVYWTNVGDGTVMRIKIDGSSQTIIAESQNYPYGIAVNDEFVYWTNEGPSVSSVDGDVLRRKLDLSAPAESIAPLPPYPPQQYPQSIVVDKTNVYWTNATQVTKTERDGSEATIIGNISPPKIVSGFSNIAVSGDSVFWTSTDENTINKVSVGGANPKPLATSPTPFGIAVDETHVYWTSSADGTVWRVGINEGTPMKLASDQAFPVGIAVDETCIYWANRNDGTVMKLAK